MEKAHGRAFGRHSQEAFGSTACAEILA